MLSKVMASRLVNTSSTIVSVSRRNMSDPSSVQTFSVKTVKPGDDKTFPKAGNTVTVHYTGTLLNGKVFDSSRSRNTPFTFKIGQGSVIRGWDEGVLKMSLGERAEIVCSPSYAYGARGYPPVIPANSHLVFDVELLNIQN